MKALVTGSAGFIGTHVSRALLGDGFEVTGYDQKESAEPGVESVVGDFLDLEALTEAVQGTTSSFTSAPSATSISPPPTRSWPRRST